MRLIPKFLVDLLNPPGYSPPAPLPPRKPTPQEIEQAQTIHRLNEALIELASRDDAARAEYMERVSELVEARQMAGNGPWQVPEPVLRDTDRIIEHARAQYGKDQRVREANPLVAQGAYGDIELALQNVEWRREVSLSWMEFSRWGIQQIILITRLMYAKTPIVRRLIDVCASYVFARGVEVTSNDDIANATWKEFLADNQSTLGQNALTDLERRKDYDGNLFFLLFTDTQDTGKVKCRTVDAVEIQEIVTDPEDVDTPWLYKRIWTARIFDPVNGTTRNDVSTKWYPALRYIPDEKPDKIGGHEVEWEQRIHHRKCGGVAKWLWGCPRMFPANAYARESKKILDACASIKASLAQIAIKITTKGGQQAMAGIKNQFGTTVGPTSSLWDQNPPANAGSTFVSGPGTSLEAFNTRGAGGDPEEVRQFKLMACMVAGVPETFLSDVSTGNLATATSLDRPTETGFLERQESWREDLLTIAGFVLEASAKAPSGKIREAFGESAAKRRVTECRIQEVKTNGVRVYEDFGDPKDGLELRCNFPAIREGDIPQLVAATVAATTLGASDGAAHGIDIKAAVRRLYDLLGIEGGDELAEDQYPEADYDPNRTKEEEVPPAVPGAPPEAVDPNAPPDPMKREALRINAALERIGRAYEKQFGEAFAR